MSSGAFGASLRGENSPPETSHLTRSSPLITAIILTGYLPRSPDGRSASASKSAPNDTAGDQEGPKNVEVNELATPSTTAPTRVPPMLPSPPSTATAKTRPMY